MLVNRLAFITTTAITMMVLLIFKIQPFIAGAITLFIVMIGYIILSIVRSKKRLSLLDDSCDPEEFLEKTEKQRAITGKNSKVNSYFDIDKAAGLITLGRFSEAKELLVLIDKNKLSPKNDSLLVYTINLMLCLYELGEVTQAEELFETQLPALSPINSRIRLAVNILVAERFFYLRRYSESRERFDKLLNQKLSNRARLGVLYCLAQIDEIEGSMEAAMKKYKQVSSEGNKLWIAKKAEEKLS